MVACVQLFLLLLAFQRLHVAAAAVSNAAAAAYPDGEIRKVVRRQSKDAPQVGKPGAGSTGDPQKSPQETPDDYVGAKTEDEAEDNAEETGEEEGEEDGQAEDEKEDGPRPPGSMLHVSQGTARAKVKDLMVTVQSDQGESTVKGVLCRNGWGWDCTDCGNWHSCGGGCHQSNRRRWNGCRHNR